MHEEGKQPQYMEEREYRKLFGLEIYLTPVFVISSIAIIAFVIGSLVFQEGATKLFGALRVWLTTNLDWLFMITTNLVFLFVWLWRSRHSVRSVSAVQMRNRNILT